MVTGFGSPIASSARRLRAQAITPVDIPTASVEVRALFGVLPPSIVYEGKELSTARPVLRSFFAQVCDATFDSY